MRPQVQDAQDVELVSPADDLVEANGRAEFDVADSQVGQRRHARPRDRFSIHRNVLRTTLFARIYDIVLQRLCSFQHRLDNRSAAATVGRSEERLVVKEWVSKCRCVWWP